ncbi:MAG: NAD(P)-dependent oxidoreductase [Lachnospiraceae bacterium]|nr:NAD(P)-dependent oxidoreductase [Lachnospiraceae bacterium]
MKKAVITGPTGAVGAALIRRLLKERYQVYAVVRPGSLRLKSIPMDPGVTVVPCDVSDLSSLPLKITEPYDAFFHLAWMGTTGRDRNDTALQDRNIFYAREALKAAAALGCKVFLFSGSQAEYGRPNEPLRPDTACHPENEYGRAKCEAGVLLREDAKALGIRMVHARILSVYGPYDGEKSMISSVIRSCLKGVSPETTEGVQIWDYLYAADAAEALYLLSLYGKDGGIYPLGSGTGRPLREYLEILRDEAAPGLPILFGAIPYGEKQIMFLQSDNTALLTDTGFTPKTDFRTGIRETIEYIRREDAIAAARKEQCTEDSAAPEKEPLNG